jgi:hypothetical protein
VDDIDRAAARLNRAAEWAGISVVLVVATLLTIAASVAALVAVAWYVLDRIGAPV